MSLSKLSAHDLVCISEARRAAQSGAAERVRVLAGITQTELGRGSGPVTGACISRWESAHRLPSGERGVKYARALAGLAVALSPTTDDPAVAQFVQVARLLRDLDGNTP